MGKNIDLAIKNLIDQGALFVVNHSGGKDSQAMFIKIREMVPASQILIVHADLPGADWKGTEEHARKYAAGFEFVTVRAGKTFFEMVRHRKMWPSPKYRQCTSDLKRGPIEKAIRAAMKNRVNKTIVNCMGLRAQESSARAKAVVFKLNAKNSVAGRTWYDYLPIHDLLIGDVWFMIKKAGELPHYAYQAGMTRLSCVFCIMSSASDIKTAAKLNPELLKKYAALEREIDQTFLMPVDGKRKFLDEMFTVDANDSAA